MNEQKHFLNMTTEEQLKFRWEKVIDGHTMCAMVLFARGNLENRPSLFVFVNGKPQFVKQIIMLETLDDDGALKVILNKFLKPEHESH